MACPDAIAVGYGGDTGGSQLIWIEGTGANKRWYPALCTFVHSGSGASAVIDMTIYPEAGGSQSRTSKSYSQIGTTEHWTCGDAFDPGAVARG
jgi:hypothetical protein